MQKRKVVPRVLGLLFALAVIVLRVNGAEDSIWYTLSYVGMAAATLAILLLPKVQNRARRREP